MLKFYGSDLSSPSNKVRFTANYLNLPHEYQRVNLRNGEQKQEWFLKLNPVGKIPVMDDDGFVLFESGAICKYLASKTKSEIYPQDLTQKAMVDQWIDFGSLHVGAAVSRVVFNRLFAPLRHIEVDERSLKEGLTFLDQFLPIVEKQLTDNKFIAGNQLSLADINLLAALDPAEISGIDLYKYSQLSQWRSQLKGQEFYTKCHKEYGESLKQSIKK